MIKKSGYTAFALAIVFLAACAARKPLSPTATLAVPAPQPDSSASLKIAEAGALLDRGGYVHLRRAFELYREADGLVRMDAATAEKYLRTSLLCDVRAKDLGVFNDSYLKTARRLIEAYPSLAYYGTFADIASALNVKIAGVLNDRPDHDADVLPSQNLLKTDDAFLAAARHDPFFALFRIALRIAFPAAALDDQELRTARDLFPTNLSLKFQLSSIPPGNPKLWDEILNVDPEYYEAHAARGERALAEKRILSAEEDLLKAHSAVPESPLLPIRLASIHFVLEEYDLCLEFYEKTLRAKPGYKEAELGKAISLSCLGRAAEAVPVLEALIKTGPALRGECYYWLAANQRELYDLASAAASIEAAKPLLLRSQVYTLSGLIAQERSLIDKAEEDFKEAIRINPLDEEAFFQLGKIYAQKKAWNESGLNFMMAAYGYEREEKELEDMAAQIQESSMAEERKAKLLLRKKAQIEKARLTKATASYNAAAGFYNSGDPTRARDWAERSAFHPYFTAKAKDFLVLISTRK
jgi:tetratricopeptide (TPR) repeat protein